QVDDGQPDEASIGVPPRILAQVNSAEYPERQREEEGSPEEVKRPHQRRIDAAFAHAHPWVLCEKGPGDGAGALHTKKVKNHGNGEDDEERRSRQHRVSQSVPEAAPMAGRAQGADLRGFLRNYHGVASLLERGMTHRLARCSTTSAIVFRMKVITNRTSPMANSA